MDTSDVSFSKCFFSLSQHDLHSPFPNNWNELVFEIHEWKYQEDQIYILASRFEILPLRVDGLFVLQELISQHLLGQRT